MLCDSESNNRLTIKTIKKFNANDKKNTLRINMDSPEHGSL